MKRLWFVLAAFVLLFSVVGCNAAANYVLNPAKLTAPAGYEILNATTVYIRVPSTSSATQDQAAVEGVVKQVRDGGGKNVVVIVCFQPPQGQSVLSEDLDCPYTFFYGESGGFQ